MAIGVVGVFALLHFMNGKSEKNDKKALAKDTSFEIKKVKKKKVVKKTSPRKRPKKVAKTTQRAAAPNISSSLSGLSFDLPQFQGNDMFGSDKLLAGSAGKKLVMTADSVDTLPKPVSRIAPSYPRKAQEKGIQGFVLLRLSISVNGDVERVKVVKAVPSGIFEDAAIAAVEQWTFEPGTYKGQPVPIQAIEQKIPFQLSQRG